MGRKFRLNGAVAREQAVHQHFLIRTRVPPSLLHTSVTPSLRNFFERFGSIEAWVPLTTFERVVVVYSREQDAEQAKQGMDYTLVEGFQPSDYQIRYGASCLS